jgi:hypothetical protein
MEERERCYSFILSRTPHETINSFRDKPTIAINCETCHVCFVFYKCNKECNITFFELCTYYSIVLEVRRKTCMHKWKSKWNVEKLASFSTWGNGNTDAIAVRPAVADGISGCLNPHFEGNFLNTPPIRRLLWRDQQTRGCLLTLNLIIITIGAIKS